MFNIETSSFFPGELLRRRRHMAHLAVKTRLAPTAREVADAREANDLPLHLMDGVIAQERVHRCYQMLHLSKYDAAIEWVAWVMVLGLLFATIWLAVML
jgi:hypothetical protein